MGMNTKKLRNRIRSVDSTMHLTRAMGLVAASKMRRASEAMLHGREYAAAVERTARLLVRCPECRKSPFLRKKGNGRTCLVVIAGDRGLAGGYNANVFRLAAQFPEADILPVGKRACERFGGGERTAEGFTYADADEMARRLCEGFAQDEWDRVGVIYTRYESMLTQTADVRWLLPLRAGKSAPCSVVFEPNEEERLQAVVPEYVSGMIIASVRESFASEVAARRAAMDSAGKNASEMIEELHLQYNRARQGAITQEITEIVAGSGGIKRR